ncbi:NACHT domain-containing protein [Kribbella sp. C-35]|uniref:NACHT domain-containing protein n=1 Tax=Kribbella sp. C-35 TaxID=2789276 RepID=UPI00397E3364
MGKTTALKAHGVLEPSDNEVEVLRVDLGRFSSEDRLARRVFENPKIATWLAGTGVLCLTLDSFDEAHGRIQNLPRMLDEYLEDWDCARLLLRIACRTADWPASLRTVLDKQFGHVDIFELLPLRRDDAAILVDKADVDVDSFLVAIEQAHVVPLAARPLTLNLLCSAMRPDGTLPGNAAELYERGLLALSDEMNPQRRDAASPSSGPIDRLGAAMRIAAISTFGGRPAIWTGPIAEAEASDILIDDCVRSEATHFSAIGRELVDATLRTALFAGRGDQRLGWSHATFADYLGARWIISNELDEAQVRSLLLSDDRSIPARVRQVAAWLVGIEPDRFRWLIPCDPEAFLGSVDLPDPSLRREVADALFTDARAGRLYHDSMLDLSDLAHPALEAQLRTALADTDLQVIRIAIDIARQCQLAAVIPELTALALDAAAEAHIRVEAALAVHDLSVDKPIHDLVTLLAASSASPDDDNTDPRELEAAALMASWPHAISTEAVFDILNPRHPRNHFGLYSIFIGDFARRLTGDDLTVACDWLSADPTRLNDSRLTQLVDAIIRLCLKHLSDSKARETVKQIAFHRADGYEPLFRDEAFEHETELESADRRALALLLFEDATDHQVWSIIESASGHGLALVRAEDLGWLLEQYGSSDGTLKENIGTAASYIHNPDSAAHSEVVLGLAENHPAAELFSYWRTYIRLDSPEATAARDALRRRAADQERMTRRRTASAERDAWINPRIIANAKKAKAGDTSAFWQAIRLVTVRPGTQRYMDEFQPDVTAHPRWATLPAETHQDLLDATSAYLRNGRCEPEKWLSQGDAYFPAQAAYRALLLLLKERPDELSLLSGEVWREWAPILVSWTATVNGARAEDKAALLSFAIPSAYPQLLTTLLTLLDRAIAANEYTFLRDDLAFLESDQLASELVERLRRPMGPLPRNDILDALMENHIDLARPVLYEWLAPQARAQDPVRAHTAVIRLLQWDTADAWPVLHDLMDSDPDFMKSAFLTIGYGFDRRPPHLHESQMADLYIWLRRQFPASEDPQFEEAHVVDARESAGSWRDSLLNALRRIGTRQAVLAVERIVAAFPDNRWLLRAVVDARRSYRDTTWEALSPSELDRLASSRRARLVRNDEDLLAVTVDALNAVQQRLQGDTPSASLLWDTHSKRPKSEEEVSDYLAIELSRRLQDRAVIVNREVQVRRTKPAGLAERTDLRLEAAPPPGHATTTQTLRIPGEVKGAWNPGIIDSIQSQLVSRYMADFQTNYGIYIVVWFDLDSWSNTDSRKSKAASHGSRESLLSRLQEQATEQLSYGHMVEVVVLDASLQRPACP